MPLASKSYTVIVMLYHSKPNLDSVKDALLECVHNQVSADVLFHFAHLIK
jgi:hypothetical protein